MGNIWRGGVLEPMPHGYQGKLYTQKIERRVLKRYLYTHTHSSIIYNSQRSLKATQASINK